MPSRQVLAEGGIVPDYDTQMGYWEGVAGRRSPDHPAVRAFAQPKTELVRTELRGARTMLEVGAGNGYFTAELTRDFSVTALDFSHNMLRMNPLPQAGKVRGDAEHLPFGDATFDVVLCGNLLHHLQNPRHAVQEMARVARLHVVLIEPNALNPAMMLFGLLKPEERGVVKFVPSYLRRLGKSSGMRLRRFVTQGAVVPNRTPAGMLRLLRLFDRPLPFGLYSIAMFDVTA